MIPKPFGSSNNCRKPSGQSLIVALIALVFLTALMGTVTVELLTEARFSDQQHDRLTAFYLARAGLEAAVNQLLIEPPATPAAGSASQANEQEVAQTQLGAGYYKAGCSDEQRKVNINKAEPGVLQHLDPAFTDEIVKAVVERRAKRPFTSVEELAALPGVRANFLTASTANAKEGLGSLLTVWGDEKDTSSKYYSITAVGYLADDPAVGCTLRQVVRKGPEGLRVMQFEQLR